MNCPKCKSELKVKNGVIRGAQRYKCKDCSCHYTVSFQQQTGEERKIRFALSLYLEGLGFHPIGRLLGVSRVSVLSRIRKHGEELSVIRNPRPVKLMALDELHSYCGNKKLLRDTGWC